VTGIVSPAPNREALTWAGRQLRKSREHRGWPYLAVVGTFHGVSIGHAPLRNDSVERVLHVTTHVRVVVLVDGERGRGVQNEKVGQPDLVGPQLGPDGTQDFFRHEVAASGLGTQRDRLLAPSRRHHHTEF